MVKLVLSVIMTSISLLFGTILHPGERPSFDVAYASYNLFQSPGTMPEDIQKGEQHTGNSSEVRSEGGSEREQEQLSREPQGTTVETGNKVRITFLSLIVLKTHLDQYSPHWKVWVGIKDNSTIPVDQKEDVLAALNWVPVTKTSTFKLYPYDDWYYPFPSNSNVTYFDIYVPEYQTKKSNTGLLIYAYGSVSTNSNVLGLEDNKLGNISAFYTDDEAYGLGQHHTTSSKGDYILAYRVDDIGQPKNLQGSQDLSTENLNLLNNTNTE